ncbi:MAG: hypothetical protein J5I92_10765 [Thiogranum sp.]|nr:hypothetical protein [Thiogranum sp.]
MKTIRVNISDQSSVYTRIAELDKQLPDSTRTSPDFHLLYQQAVTTIEDFVSKAKKLARTGTTIHIQKQIDFPGLTLLIVLDSPQRVSFLGKLKQMFVNR